MYEMILLQGILYYIKDICAVISLVLILKNIFTEKFSGSLVKYISYGTFSALAVFLCYKYVVPCEYGYEIIDFVSNMLYIAAVFIFLNKPAVLRTLTVLFLYLFTVDMLWSFVSPYAKANIYIELVFDIFAFAVVSIIIKRTSDYDDVNIIAGAFREIPRWIIAALLLFELTCYYKEFGISSAMYDFFYAVSACMIFVCILYLVFRVFRLVYVQNGMQKTLAEQLDYSEKLTKSDEQLRAFRHDLKNHIIVINSFFEQGDSQGAKNYFSQLTSDTSSFIKHFSTGSSVVDSLLDIKSGQAAKYNTEIDFSGMIPSDGIENKDLCICVGNLIDNAIEACGKLPSDTQKKIEITGKVKNNNVILTVKNPFIDNNIKNGEIRNLKTSKKDTSSHGIGLKNVKATAKKYNGNFTMNASDGIFISELILQMNL